MSVASMNKRLEKLQPRFEPPKGPQFIRILFVAPGGEIKGENIIKIGGHQ